MRAAWPQSPSTDLAESRRNVVAKEEKTKDRLNEEVGKPTASPSGATGLVEVVGKVARGAASLERSGRAAITLRCETGSRLVEQRTLSKLGPMLRRWQWLASRREEEPCFSFCVEGCGRSSAAAWKALVWRAASSWSIDGSRRAAPRGVERDSREDRGESLVFMEETWCDVGLGWVEVGWSREDRWAEGQGI